MTNLKIGDRVKWKVTSQFIMTIVAGQRAEVVSVAHDLEGLITTFKNLDHHGEHEHTYVVVGEIAKDIYDLIV